MLGLWITPKTTAIRRISDSLGWGKLALTISGSAHSKYEQKEDGKLEGEHENEKTREIVFLQKCTRKQTVLSCCSDHSSFRKVNLQTNVTVFFLNTPLHQQFRAFANIPSNRRVKCLKCCSVTTTTVETLSEKAVNLCPTKEQQTLCTMSGNTQQLSSIWN